VRKNINTAFELYLQAAEAGYPSAQGSVGNLYVTAYPKHEACEINPEQGVAWYLLAACHGNAGAQCNLAKHYLNGYDVRIWQEELRGKGLSFIEEVDPATAGPGFFIIEDPDGNPILVDQHR